MKTAGLKERLVVPALILSGVLAALAGGQGGSRVAGVPVFALMSGRPFSCNGWSFSRPNSGASL